LAGGLPRFLSAIRYPLSAIRYPLSAIRYPLSAFNLLHSDDIDCLSVRVEDDLRLAAIELTHYVRDFLRERVLPVAIVRSFAQHERFNDARKRIRGEFPMGNDDGILGFFGHEIPCTNVVGNRPGSG
jgi:hypothetical protein